MASTLPSIAQINVMAASGSLAFLSADALTHAHNAVLFARDPAWMGEEPHLRCVVDSCGIDDDRLVELDNVVWTEIARREDARREMSDLRMAA